MEWIESIRNFFCYKSKHEENPQKRTRLSLLNKSVRDEITDLVFPLQCAGCGVWGQNLCTKCWLLADQLCQLSALDNSYGVPDLPVWSLGSYGDTLRQIILSAKHQPGRELRDFLFQAGANLGQNVALNLELVDSFDDKTIWVVPAPSSHKRRRLGKEVTLHVAEGVACGISASLDCEALVVPALKLKFGRGSQASKGKQSRSNGRKNSMYLAYLVPENIPLVVVDDVLTTGSTVTEMCRCLGSNLQAATVLATA